MKVIFHLIGQLGPSNPGQRKLEPTQPKVGNTDPTGQDTGGIRKTCSPRSHRGTIHSNQPTKTTFTKTKGMIPQRSNQLRCLVPGIRTRHRQNIIQVTNVMEN